MELQQQRSCVLSADVPALEDTPIEASTAQQRVVLQERSANWPHEYNVQNTSVKKQSRTPSPTTNNYGPRAAQTGSYFTGNVHAQHIGLAGFGVERSEKQIEFELKRLYRMLQRSDKYQKYREKQPVLTVSEFLAREAAERRAREARGEKPGKEDKDKAVWPEFLEDAFWRALVRWPPMGRKKYMLDGALRGRNELIQDSIQRDTGVERNRKQVSSHLQVLKQHLRDQKGVLVYMATNDNEKKRRRGSESSHPYHISHMRSRHHAHRTASASKYDYSAPSAHLWPGHGPLSSSLVLGTGLGNDVSSSPYTVTDFTMFVEDDDQPVHYFTQLSSSGRLSDLNVTDTSSWRRQYPEFDFLRSQTDDWTKQDRKVLVCDASIKTMTEAGHGNLSITFNLHTQRELSVFESVECITRFYDSGDGSPDLQFDGPNTQDLKEQRTRCDYSTDPQNPSGRLRIAFGSKFWVNRMLKYQSLRLRDESCVSRSLLRLTATQDVYGIKRGTGEAECVLTILWRFAQTRSSAEVGSMTWRAVSFGNSHVDILTDQKWMKDTNTLGTSMEDVHGGHEEDMDCSTSVSQQTALYHQDPQIPLDFPHLHQAQHSYAVQSPHPHHHPQLHLDILASMQPELEQPHASAAPSASTDYSQQSIPNIAHGQHTVPSYAHDPNDFDFNGGHITISGAFEPSINLSAYETFASQSSGLEGLHALAGLDQDGYNLGLACADGNELVGVENGMQGAADMTCYSTKPNWHHANLISSLENAAEQYHSQNYIGHEHPHSGRGHEGLQSHGNYTGARQSLGPDDDLVAHGLHDAHVNVNPGLWNLQSPFHEDTGSGANNMDVHGAVDCRRDSVGQGMNTGHSLGLGLGLGVLDLIERDQKARGY